MWGQGLTSLRQNGRHESALTRFAYFCGHEQWQPEQLVEHARIAEDAGFDMVVVSEHFHPWVDDGRPRGSPSPLSGPWRPRQEHIEFATGVTTPLFRYHPGVVAQAAATLDRLSSGRFTLGVGTGENINEGPLGYPFPGYAERNARMTESLEIMRRLLDGEKLTYEGEYYRTDRAMLYSPPLGPVPILLAAGGPKSADLAGRLAQGVVTSVKDPAETMENVVNPVRTAATSAGRPDPLILATRWAVMAADEDEAWKALYSWRGLRAPGRLEAVDPADLRERADALPRQEILGRYPLVATAHQIVDVYRPLVEDLGADVVTIQMASLDQQDLIRLIGSEVLPVLRNL